MASASACRSACTSSGVRPCTALNSSTISDSSRSSTPACWCSGAVLAVCLTGSRLAGALASLLVAAGACCACAGCSFGVFDCWLGFTLAANQNFSTNLPSAAGPTPENCRLPSLPSARMRPPLSATRMDESLPLASTMVPSSFTRMPYSCATLSYALKSGLLAADLGLLALAGSGAGAASLGCGNASAALALA